MVGYWQDERKHLIVNGAYSNICSLMLYLFNIIQKRIFVYLVIHQKTMFMLSTKFKVQIVTCQLHTRNSEFTVSIFLKILVYPAKISMMS